MLRDIRAAQWVNLGYVYIHQGLLLITGNFKSYPICDNRTRSSLGYDFKSMKFLHQTQSYMGCLSRYENPEKTFEGIGV
jgi:hypothetical protein